MQDLRQGNCMVYELARTRTSDAASTWFEVKMRIERSLLPAVGFMYRVTVRSIGSSDASGQMHLRIARVICTFHMSSFVYVMHNEYAQYTPLTNVYLYSND